MSKQYHYVVVYDEDSNEFSLDIDTLQTYMIDGIVWDADAQDWVADMSAHDMDYRAKEDILARWLQGANRGLAFAKLDGNGSN